jgi:alpha-amylase
LRKVSFALVIHSHQPVGNFDHVFEEAYQKAYAPFVRTLLLHSRIRVCLHYSGILLEWLDQHHPEFFQLLRQLIRRAQVELIGGGYYEPILPAVPDTDKVIQLRKLDAYLRDHFGMKPRGAWIAERVWEPGLAQPLAEAGVEYTILDDTHFLAAGLEPFELRGTYITEEGGMPLRLVPSLKALRYAIPFREPEETLRILSEGKGQPGALLAMGDDCEKFGVWPGTYEHCYQNGWLERFFKALEEAHGWLETTTLSDFLAAHPPLGRIYLPTASYAEMMEWALPLRASNEFKACLEETERTPGGERIRRFLRGGMWRNFLSKYPEANQLHKLMLEVSRRWHAVSQATSAGERPTDLLHQAQTHLLASQCNDAYWHGVFGGLYAPHLRSALLRHLIQAESLLDKLGGTEKNPVVRVTTKDFDVDGQEEVLVHHPAFGMVLRPADGGTISSLRFKPADVELINSLMRRPEPYHETVRRHVASHQAPKGRLASIHDRILSKEANLDALLRYDRYFRHSFRTYIFPVAKTWQDFEALLLEENEAAASGPWSFVAKDNPTAFEFRRETLFRSNGSDLRLMALKEMTLKVARGACQLECRHSLSRARAGGEPLAVALEMVFNLLAPNAPDRYFLANEIRRPLESKGEINAPNLVMVDEWQHVKISLEASPQPRWWIAPVETISQSESGFERVYQGSAILAVWKVEAPSWRDITCTLRVEVEHLVK